MELFWSGVNRAKDDRERCIPNCTEGARNYKEMESTLNNFPYHVQDCIVTFIRGISSPQAASNFLQPI